MYDIHIRHTEVEDAEQIRDLYAGRLAAAGTLQLPYSSKKKWQNRLNNIPEGHYGLVAVKNDEVIGHIGFDTYGNPRRKHAGHIGMGVKDVEQGKGVGSLLMKQIIDFADNWLNINRIELTVYTDNKAAIKLYERSGFIIEGTAKQFAFRDGKYIDAHFMARLSPSSGDQR